MPRCNLTLKQKTQLIELSEHLSTGQLAKKFRVHATTVTRTIKKKERILDQASRVNPNFKTVQTNLRSEEHDAMVLDYIRSKQGANIPISVTDICDKAMEFANTLGREIKSRRAWWRRFRIRCNVVRQRLGSTGNSKSSDEEEISLRSNESSGNVTNLENTTTNSPKKIITLPTINLPCPMSAKVETSSKNADVSTLNECVATPETETSSTKTTKDLAENSSNGHNDVKACKSDKEIKSPGNQKQTSSPSKKRKPRKAIKNTKRGRKKKTNNSSVMNFTFKIKKTPSKSVPSK